MTQNPFQADTRKMPVEFGSIASNRIVITITLPEGYELDGEAKNTVIVSQDKGLEGRYTATTGEGRMILSCQFNINKVSHSEKSYPDLKQIFKLFSEYNTAPLVFKKK